MNRKRQWSRSALNANYWKINLVFAQKSLWDSILLTMNGISTPWTKNQFFPWINMESLLRYFNWEKPWVCLVQIKALLIPDNLVESCFFYTEPVSSHRYIVRLYHVLYLSLKEKVFFLLLKISKMLFKKRLFQHFNTSCFGWKWYNVM